MSIDRTNGRAGARRRLRQATMLAGSVAVLWLSATAAIAQGYSLYVREEKACPCDYLYPLR